GSHTDVHKKGPPNRRIAGQALSRSSPTRVSSSKGSKSAKAVRAPRYSRSPTFVPRSACPRGAGAITGSIGSVVISGERIRRVSRDCNAETKKPPAGAYRRTGGERQSGGGLPSCRRPDRL